ncbi:putative Bifunctional P-450/NADPH-P450 reductase [Seiridium unicorne]|uniref:Bifunctional cytochrome P450/NADPH--P450 reductase n=1 Tax=Seiridium unicorne TaxID=138068 RepID=A0ABR2UKW0_9PEZI
MSTTIPEPGGYPFIGNVADIDPNFPVGSFGKLADKYGEIYRIRFPGSTLVVTSTFALVDELCNEKRFKKIPDNVLTEVRNGVHDGLFTAYIEEPNWAIAHRILMPAFGPKSIREMFPEMHDIASQLVLKWARQGADHPIPVTDDFTKLALDTLGLCSMGFRFNNFYSEKEHPFVNAMGQFLSESGRRSQRVPLPSFFYRQANEDYENNIKILRETADSVLQERVSNGGGGRRDLLTAMLEGRDSQTGEKLSDSAIINNLITFLIAGHETTSGTLSYAMNELLRNPEAYRKVQQEVDEVIGKAPVTVEHMQKLPYIEAVLREALRLDAPIPIFSRHPIEDNTLLGGKYVVNKGDTCILLLSRSHLDPAVFEEPLKFLPERMLPANFNKLPKNAWKPFGSGVRACIGRPFAWQESVLTLALLFQNFDFELDDPSYVLQHKQTLTIKPKDFYIRAKLRPGINPTSLSQQLNGSVHASPKGEETFTDRGKSLAIHEVGDVYQPMTVLYGSNSGTCELMAQRLASNASSHGFQVTRLDYMDAAVGELSHGQPTVVITSSYEGQPPDNAAKFVPWLESIKGAQDLDGVKFAVFGCGNRDWSQTFHRVPNLVNNGLSAAGGIKLAEIGLADAASDDVFVVFENWEDHTLWPALEAIRPAGASISLQNEPATALHAHVSNLRSSMFKSDLQEGRVIAVRSLTADGEPLKKHVEIEMPRGSFFRAGDYLNVLPINSHERVLRILRRFRLPWDTTVTLQGIATKLPTNVPISVYNVLSDFVELGQPASRKDIITLTNATGLSHDDRKALQWLASDGHKVEVSAERTSVLDLLERFATVNIPFGTFLGMLPTMRIRQYSISSSPSDSPCIASITFALLKTDASSGPGELVGTASSYLASLQRGDLLRVSLSTSHDAFHLPLNPSQTPLIMAAAGTGIAPFRGFIQERAAMREAGVRLAPAVLYHGCRQPGKDDLYADELDKWERLGVVAVKRTFSRTPQESKGHKYVQDAMWADRRALLSLWRQGAFLYICGSREISRAVEKVAVRFKQELAASKGHNLSEPDAQKWWNELRNVRYAIDVFD